MTAKILYAWELGDNLGHIGQFTPLARRLRSAGAEVDCALAFVDGAAKMLEPEALSRLQAPVFRGRLPEGLNDPPLSYADILLLHGYADRDSLAGLVGAWRRLIELSGATLVLADHAPTAILAARTLGIPVMLHAAGFYAPPPDLSPAPGLRPWEPTPLAVLQASERRVLRTINEVLNVYGSPPLPCLGEMFQVAETALNTFPELDPYGPRRDGRYWGTPPSFTATPVMWPAGAGPRIYGYLRAGFPGTEAALAALSATRCRALVFCPDAPAEWRSRFDASHVSITSEPVNLEQAGREADAAILYAPHGTTASMLLAGTPLVMMPLHLEQGLLAWRVEVMGAGFMVWPRGRFTEPAPALAALLSSGNCKARAMAFARKYVAVTPDTAADNMAARALQLARGAAVPLEPA
jgi:UDP:flavonoid glycosyltransferase YjiC (YdhE family)